ncbi:MAG TPA: acyltransferase [Polyangia bacterium]
MAQRAEAAQFIAPAAFVPALQALRGLAALAVVIFHADVFLQKVDASVDLPGVRYGWLGVDLFCVLSAFVLTRMLNGTRRPRYGDFVVDRLLRVLPAYYVALAATGLAVLTLDPGSVSVTGFLANLALVQNLDHGWYLALNPTFWTLAVEVQFYLLLPLLLGALGARPASTRRVLIWALVAVASAMVVRAVGFVREDVVQSTISLPAFAGHFALGILAARIGSVRRPGWWFVGALPFLLVPPLLWVPESSAGCGYDTFVGATFVRPLVAFGCAALVLAAASPGRLRERLERPVWLWLGRISFSLYVIHALVLAQLLEAFPSFGVSAKEHPLVYTAVGTVLSLIAGKALYGVVEGPAEAWRRRRKRHGQTSPPAAVPARASSVVTP